MNEKDLRGYMRARRNEPIEESDEPNLDDEDAMPKQFYQPDVLDDPEAPDDFEELEYQAKVTINLTVHSLLTLHDAALKRAIAEGMTEQNAKDSLDDEDGNIDVGACLVMLLDPGSLPGCEIHDSEPEVWQ